MNPPATIHTRRLRLRPFGLRDARGFLLLAGEWEVARMTADIPHPLHFWQIYRWLVAAPGEVRFAIEHNGALIGGVGYFRSAPGIGELGFWLGRAYWGRGFATEAAEALVLDGFARAGLSIMTSANFVDNPASARVLEKLGFTRTGRQTTWCRGRNCEVDVDTWLLERAAAPSAGSDRGRSVRLG